MRDIGQQIGITERAAHRIVADLVNAGTVTRKRKGNRNRYEIVPDAPMDHPLLQEHWIGEILAVLADRPWPAEQHRGGSAEKPAQRTEPAQAAARRD